MNEARRKIIAKALPRFLQYRLQPRAGWTFVIRKLYNSHRRVIATHAEPAPIERIKATNCSRGGASPRGARRRAAHDEPQQRRRDYHHGDCDQSLADRELAKERLYAKSRRHVRAEDVWASRHRAMCLARCLPLLRIVLNPRKPDQVRLRRDLLVKARANG